MKLLNIDKYDLNYVYHHLKIGDYLNLVKNGDWFTCYYKNFRIGDLPNKRVYIIPEHTKVRILNIEKERFMLPNEIEVEIIIEKV